MAKHRVKAILTLVTLSLWSHAATAQRTTEQLAQALVGQPLYLHGMWTDNNLEFDERGTPRKPSEAGPLTLSGIDVMSFSMQGKNLILHGRRVALIANDEGRLERLPIYSTTHIFGSLRRSPNNNFIADLEMRLVVHLMRRESSTPP